MPRRGGAGGTIRKRRGQQTVRGVLGNRREQQIHLNSWWLSRLRWEGRFGKWRHREEQREATTTPW